jgi:hypothetical protein
MSRSVRDGIGRGLARRGTKAVRALHEDTLVRHRRFLGTRTAAHADTQQLVRTWLTPCGAGSSDISPMASGCSKHPAADTRCADYRWISLTTTLVPRACSWSTGAPDVTG